MILRSCLVVLALPLALVVEVVLVHSLSSTNSSCQLSLSQASSQRNGPGCNNLSDVTLSSDCAPSLQAKPTVERFDQADENPGSLVQVRINLSGTPPSAGYLIKLYKVVNGTLDAVFCDCWYVGEVAAQAPVILSSTTLEQCIDPYGIGNASTHQSITGKVTSLPISEEGTYSSQTSPLPTLVLNSCIDNFCTPLACLMKCVPVKPVISLTRIANTTFLFQLLSKPQFPADFYWEIGVSFTGYYITISTNSSGESQNLTSFTNKFDTTNVSITVPSRFIHSSLQVQASVLAERQTGSKTVQLVGDVGVFEYKVGNGSWSSWEWTPWSVTCGNSSRQGTRYCYGQRNGGVDCQGDNTTIGICQLQKCPGPPQWSSWAASGSCTRDCHQKYQRVCLNETTNEECPGQCVRNDPCSILCLASSEPNMYLIILSLPAIFIVITGFYYWRKRLAQKTTSIGYMGLSEDDDESEDPAKASPPVMPLSDYLAEIRAQRQLLTGRLDTRLCFYISHDRQTDYAVELAKYLGRSEFGCPTALDILSLREIADRRLFEKPEHWLDATLNWTAGVYSDHRPAWCACGQGVGACHHLPTHIIFLCTPELKRYLDVDRSATTAATAADQLQREDEGCDMGEVAKRGYRRFLPAEKDVACTFPENVLVVLVKDNDTLETAHCIPEFLKDYTILVWHPGRKSDDGREQTEVDLESHTV